MLLAYIDESGNTGAISRGGTVTYSLGCVLIDAAAWPAAFDGLLQLRRNIRDRYKVPVRTEVKAAYLLRNGGGFRALGLAPEARRAIFAAHLAALRFVDARAFGVVIDKRKIDRHPRLVFDLAWETLFQRLAITSRVEKKPFMVLHDEGENLAVRRWARRSRRFLPAGSAYGAPTRGDARLLVDDPVPLQSHNSYFIQVADLTAYAAFRANIPPSLNVARVCPASMWDALGAATHTAVSRFRPRSAPGIVIR